jgi:hypothetical protein
MEHVPSRTRAWTCGVLLICLAGAPSAFAQQTGGGTLTGTVVDKDGVVPGASVTVTADETNLSRTSPSNEVGLFRFAALPPGKYTVKVEMSGFRTITVNDIALLSGEVRDVGTVTMQVGGQAETVNVTADVTPVQVATSARKAAITSDELTNIQMKGRDIYGMVALVPGVMDTNFSRDFTNWESAKLTTINGAPVNNKNLMIDGIGVMDEGGTGNAYVNPNIDAVGEVQIIANGYTAENGKTNGGAINFITKSGTNRFSGSGWFNAKRDAWNANDYVRIRQGQPKPLYDVNIGGYSIGGPVIVPGVFDARTAQKKVFFFFSQEYTSDAKPSVTTRANVPTALERNGDFSQTLLANGSVQAITDPLTGKPFPGNIIPQAGTPGCGVQFSCINGIGQRLLNLLQQPNGYVSTVAGEQNLYNYIDNQTPLHSRTDHVFRGDATLSQKTRISGKFLADREDNIVFSQWGPGQGVENNFVPGFVVSGTVTTVLRPTLVNEINGGFSLNHYGYRATNDGSSGYPGGYNYEDYFCQNVGVCPPRIQPYGTGVATYDPSHLKCCSFAQADQYPYVPITTFQGGSRQLAIVQGSTTTAMGYNPGMANGRVLPAANRNNRWQFQDDLTKTMGRHSFKLGLYIELDSKTEPGTTNYMGNFNFGSATTNPLDTGNGYANALLGIFQTYQEANVRVDKDVRHWQNEFYAQDSWKMNPRFTLDYGVRFTHSGPFYEIHQATAAFYPELYNPAKAPRIYTQVCSNPAIQGNQTCPANQRFAADPANPTQLVSFAYAGNFVPGTGDYYNGMLVDGLGSSQIGTGKPGQYWYLPYLVGAPRVGFAWDVNGDGKSALRSSFGVFYNFPRGVPPQFVGTAPTSVTTTIRNATIDQLANFSSGQLVATTSPVSSGIATLKGERYGLPKAYEMNVAYQRDIGFSTVVEAAYVGNFILDDYRTVPAEDLPLYVYADPKNQFNGAEISANYLRVKYPGMGTITDVVNDMTSLQYNSLQLSVQRRLSKGLQMGMAYTLSKGMGLQGYDNYTANPNITMANVGGSAVVGGPDAINARYWGPTSVDRRHNLVVNYAYMIPNTMRDTTIVKWIVSDWQVSGVTKFITGTAATPACSSTLAGVANTDPSFTGLGTSTTAPVTATRCQLTGQPIFSGYTVDPDPLAALHFNPAAFAMAQPISATVGNFGNTPVGILRNPSWSNWDLTLARAVPLRSLGRKATVRMQFQIYNIFNQVQWTTLNTTLQFTTGGALNGATAGRYSPVVNPPRQFGITARLDF